MDKKLRILLITPQCITVRAVVYLWFITLGAGHLGALGTDLYLDGYKSAIGYMMLLLVVTWILIIWFELWVWGTTKHIKKEFEIIRKKIEND